MDHWHKSSTSFNALCSMYCTSRRRKGKRRSQAIVLLSLARDMVESDWCWSFTAEPHSLSVLVIHVAISPAVAHRVVVLGVAASETLTATSTSSSSLWVVAWLAVETCRDNKVKRLKKTKKHSKVGNELGKHWTLWKKVCSFWGFF